MKGVQGFATFVSVLFLLAGCTTNAQTAPATTGKTVEVSITAKQFAFEPAVVSVHKGDHVRLLVSSPDVMHGISIPALKVNARIPPGETTPVEFDATAAGFFEFRCSVFCGDGHSHMMGAVEVLEGTS